MYVVQQSMAAFLVVVVSVISLSLVVARISVFCPVTSPAGELVYVISDVTSVNSLDQSQSIDGLTKTQCAAKCLFSTTTNCRCFNYNLTSNNCQLFHVQPRNAEVDQLRQTVAYEVISIIDVKNFTVYY